MNLLTNYDAVVSALIEMEGSDWVKWELSSREWRGFSIENARAKAQMGMDSVIHGAGGGRRYQVDGQGNVVLRKQSIMGMSRDVEAAKAKATNLGFRLV